MQHNLIYTWRRGGDEIVKNRALTADGEKNLDPIIPAATSNVAVALTLTVAQVKSLYIVSDQAVTLVTNGGVGSFNTINLTAGVPVVWAPGDQAACPFSFNVTSMVANNAGSDPANLQFRILEDITP